MAVKNQLPISDKMELGRKGYLNRRCWLVKALNYPPYERCQYCDLNFHNCLFLHYQIISIALVVFFLIFSFLIEQEISIFGVLFVFATIIIYGYYFNKSTEGIIKANFMQRETEKSLKLLNENLERRVGQRTKELKKAYEELKVLDRAKTEFISIASHQLRTPLGVMRGYLSMLIKGDFGSLKPKAKEAVEEVYQASLRLLKLSNDLLNVSQIESGSAVLNYKKVSLKELIEDIVEGAKIEAKNKKIVLKTKLASKLPMAEIDVDMIRQVLLNIIDNAIKYTEKGSIEIKLSSPSEDIALIEIKDSGMGLGQDDIDNLFHSFFRGQAGKKLHPAGTGLGLYIAQKFIYQHKGRLWVESPGPGKGSSFFIELPFKKPKVGKSDKAD